MNAVVERESDDGWVSSLTVGSDGASSGGQDGPAGWGWVAEDGTWGAGSILRGTNQVGELLGLYYAIHDHLYVVNLTVETDSAYAMNTYLTWMDAHRRRGWRTADGKPTSNREIIELLMEARTERHAYDLPPVRIVKVKGHLNGVHPLNELADERAVRAKLHAKKGVEKVWHGSGLVVPTAGASPA